MLRCSPRTQFPRVCDGGVGSDRRLFPLAAGPVVEAGFLREEAGRNKGGPMASDITLAVGDGARRMTYAELAQARGISLASARRLVRRHGWGRQAGNDGVVRVTVPLPALQRAPPPGVDGLGHSRGLADGSGPGSGPGSGLGSGLGTTRTEGRDTAECDGLGQAEAVPHGTRPMLVPERPTLGPGTAPMSDGTDPLIAIGIQTLSQAVRISRSRTVLCFPSESGPNTWGASLRGSAKTPARGSASCRPR